ncbi:MAG: CAP domain-containing protein [Paracoccus sp. (in: a-proteobacteria)]|nr:CAP domain-containing protein [Paracoccus sp. (in: a-proteobacteria)]
MTNCSTLGALSLTVALMAACGPASAPPPETPSDESVSAPRLPGGFLRTDGRGDVAVTKAGAVQCAPTSAQDAATALAATNAVRARAGLAALQTHAAIQRAAESHACDMARRGLMTHAGSSTTGPAARVRAEGYGPRVTSENIAAGRMDLQRTLAEWSSSPDHQSNVVIPGLRHMGIGSAVGSDGRTVFWAAVYAQPR